MKKYLAGRLHSILTLLLLFSILISALHVFRISYHSYLTDSEIWGISSSKNFWQFTHETAGSMMKPLFHALLSLFFLFSKTSADLFLNTRVLAAINCVTTLFITIYFCKRITHSTFVAMLCGALIASSYHFLLWFPSVRADSFSSLPLLIGFFLILTMGTLQNHTPRWPLIILTQILAFLITPKVVFLILLQWFLIFYFLKGRNQFVISRKRLITFLSVILLAGISLLSFSDSLYHLSQALDFFLSAFHSKEAPYFSALSFYYVFRFIIEDFILVLISFCALISYIVIRERRATGYFIIVLFVWLLLIFYNERLPFFISSLVPLLSLATTCLLFFTFEKYRLAQLTRYRPLIFSIAALGLASWLYFINIKAFESTELQFSNAKQIKTINILEHALANNLLAWDAIGILPTKNILFAYLGTENAFFNSVAADQVMRVRPSVVFLVGRTLVYWPKAPLWLASEYIDIGNGIWVAKEMADDQQIQSLITVSKTLPENLITLFQFNTQY